MKIGILGDTHANISWIRFALWKMHKEGISEVLQVGDFGIGENPHSVLFTQIASELAEKYGITLRVVPGNHESWPLINRLTSGIRTEWAELAPNILIAPRGIRWEWDSVTFVALGGAPSVDRTWRLAEQEYITDFKKYIWFEDEMITWEDVEYVAAGGHADVMVGHDAPEGVPTIENRIGSNPFGWDPSDLLYAADGRKRYTEAFKAVAPDTVLAGHYHFKVDDMIPNGNGGWTNVVVYNCDGTNDSMGHYDTETKKAHVWDVSRDIDEYNDLVRKKT